MNIADHLLGLIMAVLAVLAPAPLAAVLAGCSRTGGPGLRLVALLSWWIALGMAMLLGLGWCALLGRWTLLIAMLLLGVIGMLAWRWLSVARQRISGDADAAWQHWRNGSAAERIALAVLVATAVVWTVVLTVVPSNNYDTHMYQLPIAAEWLQHGTVAARSEQWHHAPSYERSMFHYPAAWNAWYALVLGLGGHERWAFLPNLLALGLYGAAVRALARQAGAVSVSATLAAALAMSMPVAGCAVMSAHNDLPLAATWLAAVVAAVAAARSGDALWLAMTVLLSGMAFGIKPNGAAAGGCAGIAFIATLAHPGRLTAVLHGLRRGWPWLVLATLLVALVALPWYIRNAVETGNPLGFMRLRMFGHELPGTIDAAYIAKTTLLHNFHPGDLHHWGWLGASLGVYLGLAWLGLLLPILRWRHWHRGIIGLLVLAAALGWAWIAGPWSAKHEHDPDLSFWMGQQLRYTFALWGVVAALAAAVARPASWLWPVQIIVLWCSVLTGTWITMRVQGAPSLVAPVMASVITVVFAVIIVRGRRPWRRWLPVAVLVALAVLPWVLRDWRLGLRNWYFFGAPSALARLPDDRPIAFWATHQAWLLYGDRLRRQPVFLPLDTAKSDEELARMVLGSGCDHLAIGETWPPTPPDVIERLIAAGVVQPIHGAPRQWGMKILRIIR